MLTDLSGWAVTAVAVLGVLSVAAGVAVFVVDSMARATFALLASFLAVAGILLALDLVYLALCTIVIGMSPAGFIMNMIMKTAMIAISIVIISAVTTAR